jgi:hypothetical protein
MNTFNVKKRKVLSFSDFDAQAEQVQGTSPKPELGEADLVKKSMPGEKKGDAGVATLDEGEQNANTFADFYKKNRETLDEIRRAADDRLNPDVAAWVVVAMANMDREKVIRLLDDGTGVKHKE